jgi:hypothetical protein
MLAPKMAGSEVQGSHRDVMTTTDGRGTFNLISPRKEINSMSLSQLARSIRESATLKLNETAALLRDKGEPIIHL